MQTYFRALLEAMHADFVIAQQAVVDEIALMRRLLQADITHDHQVVFFLQFKLVAAGTILFIKFRTLAI